MSSNTDIANSALIKLGQEKLPSTYPDATTKRGISISEQFPKVLKRLLRGHPWNFAMKRTKVSVAVGTVDFSLVSISNETLELTGHGYVTGQKVQVSSNGTLPSPLVAATDYYIIKSTVDLFKLATSLSNAIAGTAINLSGTMGSITIPFADVSTGADTFTYVGHGFITGQKVILSSTLIPPTLSPSASYYFAIAATANTIKLATSLVDALALTGSDITVQGNGVNTITASDTVSITPQDKTPEFQYDFQANLPSDYVRAFKVTSDQDGSQNIDHEIENGKILCNYDSFYLAYTALVIDASLFPDDFAECFALLLASECAYDIVQNKELKISLMVEFKESLGDTRFNDGFETTNEPLQVDYFIQSRY